MSHLKSIAMGYMSCLWNNSIFFIWIGRIFFIVTSECRSIITVERERCGLLALVHLIVHRAHSSQSVGIKNSGTTVVMLSFWAYADSERLVYYLETWAWATIQPMKMHFSFRKVLPTPQYSIQGMMAISSYTSWEHLSHKTVAEQTEFEERRCPSERNRCRPLPLSGHCSWVDKNTRKLGVGGVNFILLRFNFNSWLLNVIMRSILFFEYF